MSSWKNSLACVERTGGHCMLLSIEYTTINKEGKQHQAAGLWSVTVEQRELAKMVWKALSSAKHLELAVVIVVQ